MSSHDNLSYETRIVNLLTGERQSLAEVIARHSRASGVSLDDADAHIKSLIDNPISNFRVEEYEKADNVDFEIDGERAHIATQTLLATTTMLHSNIPSQPMQDRLRRLAHAAVEDLELYYFGSEEPEHDHPPHEHHHDKHDHKHHSH